MAPTEPIRHLVILGHPSESSFNRAVAETYCAAVRECGQIAMFRDLYGQGFDPVLKAGERPGTPDIELAPDVAEELQLVRSADAIVLVYPIWFGMPPAIIKGYVDRVLGSGFRGDALTAGRKHPLLEGKRLVIFSTSATTLPWLEERGQWVALRQAFDDYLTAVFGMHSSKHVHFDAVTDGMGERFVYERLEQVREAAHGVCAELARERHGARARAAARSAGPEPAA